MEVIDRYGEAPETIGGRYYEIRKEIIESFPERFTRSMIRDLFPDVPESTVSKILLAMKREGVITPRGRGRVEKAVSEDESQQLSFATPEDVILRKLECYKSGGEVSDRRWTDVLGVLKVQGTQLDTDYLERWAKEVSVANLLKRAKGEAGTLENE